ncbi:MAG: hypothetical protein ACLTSX_02670 [Collinsella sp.]
MARGKGNKERKGRNYFDARAKIHRKEMLTLSSESTKTRAIVSLNYPYV